MKYAVIGDEDTVLGFGIVGVAGKVAVSAEEAQSAFAAIIADKEIAIIIITEHVADMIRSTVDRYLFTAAFPLIVEIPGQRGARAGGPGIRDMVNAAIGIKI